MAYMDYMDPDGRCPKKVVKLNHSPTHSLFLRIATGRIEEFMTTSSRWSVNQFGFRSDHRAEDSLFTINTMFDSHVIHQNTPLYVAFVDFLKIFDKIKKIICYANY